MDKTSQKICTSLPSNVTGQMTTYEQREQYLVNFLQNTLPSCDIGGIDNELKKTFVLGKHKKKVVKEKPQKSPFMTMRKSILLGLNKFGKKSFLYSDMKPLNSLWLDYMHHVLGLKDFSHLPKDSTSNSWESISQRLMKVDYHGAEVTVIRSKCPSLTGIKGIIIQDTKHTFRVICKDNLIRTIPKISCVFKIHLENDVNIEVFGKELCIRPAERSVKKFKNLHIPEL